MSFITALAACLILIQALTFHAAAREAASAYMDAASANALGRLEARVSELASLVRVLSKNPFLADSDDRSEVGGAVGLFKTALEELPQSDSLYVGYENGCWLQVRRLENLDPAQREMLGAPANAVYNINLVRPTAGGTLPRGGSSKTSRVARSSSSISGITATTRESDPGIATRCRPTGLSFRRPTSRSALPHR
jgi:adenylate cyclase